MRIDPDGTIVLSERNLLTLLYKLGVEGSQRTLIKRVSGQHDLAVKVEHDAVHYQEEAPGPMRPEIERFILEHHR